MRTPVLRICGLLIIVVMLLSGSVMAVSDPSTAKITPLDTWYEEGALGEWALFTQSGLVVEMKIEATEEIRIWPSDFAIGYIVDDQEYRVPGYGITNAVSDPEDERSWRFSQPITVRKGTRYFLVLFSELSLSLDQTAVINKKMSDFQVFYRTLLPGQLTIEFAQPEYDDYEDYYGPYDDLGW